ncbi:hypothetical protein [Chondromyces apiculatus]|uniref:Uncharacterized protein n=1 Tax=Chondromyces apiculatus DSM 436 TaxID=1192034 RepID=A0A017STK7_9BACT|nr:hypothetical protein [Chondromyces apiculatus]EYF00309.1 Hypothetical protein CAP_0961 [Chondromyces apiculatus DSM 436]
MTITSISSILFALLVFYVALKLLRRREKREAVRQHRRERSEVERWLDDALSRELSRKLSLERDLLLRALEGAPEPEAVGPMEEAVREMQAKYVWRPDGSVEVLLDVSFEDGTSASANRIFPRSAMPAAVRDEFTRTGAPSVLRPLHFPWSTPE